MTEDEAKIVSRRHRREFLDELKHRRTRQGAFEESFLHLAHPLVAGGPLLEASDGGDSARTIREACEETPHWRLLWRRARSRLPRRQRRILDALLVDSRPSAAARIAGVSRPAVHTFRKKIFKMHFAQCLRALNRDFR